MRQDTLDQLQFLVSQGRLASALEELNMISGCRFTAFYRFDESDARNLVLIDRQDPHAATMETLPVDQTYCVFVQQSRDAFLVADSAADLRLDGHAKRPLVRTYLGFPVTANDGVFGTVCHFDYDVVPFSSEVVELTQAFATAFDPHSAMAGLQRALARRLDSLRLMSEEILLASASQEEALDAFEEYAQPLRREAERLLEPAEAQQFHASLVELAARFSGLARDADASRSR